MEVGVIDDGVPRRAATADFPPLAAFPRRRRHFHLGMLERQRRIARHCIEAPDLRAGLGIVSGDIPAHAELRATVADEYLPGRRARRAGDRIKTIAVDDRVDFPHLDAGCGVERDQSTVEAADVNAALVDRYPAIDDVATCAASPFTGNFGVVGPHFLPRDGIDRIHPAPCAREEHDAVHDDGRRFLGPIGPHVAVPSKPQVGNGFPVDLLERRKPLLFVGAAVREPVARFAICVVDARVVDESDSWHGRARRLRRRLGGRRHRGVGRHHEENEAGNSHDGYDHPDQCTHEFPLLISQSFRLHVDGCRGHLSLLSDKERRR